MPSYRFGTTPKYFSLPQNNSGRATILAVGQGVTVYCDLQPPNVWNEHHHPVAQIVVSLDPVSVTLGWRIGNDLREEKTSSPFVWILPPGVPHHLEWSGTAAMLVLYVKPAYIREECGLDLSAATVLPLGPLVQQDYLFARLCDYFRTLCHDPQSRSGLLAVASGTLFTALLLKIQLRGAAAHQSQHAGLSERRLQLVSAYIDNNLRESLTPADLAKVANLTASHFSRKFKISTGLPPMKYVWRCRLHQARRLLETGEWKVASVAAETGFCDQSHLDRQFRREFGCSPGSVIP